MYWFSPFIGAFGGALIDDGEITLNTQAMVDALTYYKSLKQDGLTEARSSYQNTSNEFAQGRLAYTINGDWSLKKYHKMLGDDLGIAILPAISTNQPLIPFYSTHSLAFPNDSLNGPKRQHLLKLMKFLQSPEVQKSIWETLGVMPVESSAFDELNRSSSGVQKQMQGALKYAQPMPSDSAMSIIWSVMRKGFIRHQADVLSAERAAALMQKISDKQRTKSLSGKK